jgi:capsular polysaccharide biosynthesis protein
MTVPNKSRFQRYATVAIRSCLVIALVFSLSFVTGAYITDNFLTKYYTATAQIEIRDPATPGASISPAELETILSASVLLPVVKDLGLNAEWARRLFSSQEDTLTNLEAVGQLDKMLRLDTARGTDIVSITVTDDAPKEAADIANGIADHYKSMRDSEAQQSASIPLQQAVRYADNSREPSPLIPIGSSSTATSNTFPAVMTDVTGAPKTSAAALRESPVRIIRRAELPTTPSHPNRHFCFCATLITSVLLALIAASFVEVIYLFLRASQVIESKPPVQL